MNPLILGPLLSLGKDLIDRFLPDPEKKREAEMELFKMAADGEMKQIIAQLEINAKEAAHPSLWVAGGRPFFLWIGGVGFGYAVLLQPLFAWLALIKGWPEPPLPDVDLLWVVVSGPARHLQPSQRREDQGRYQVTFMFELIVTLVFLLGMLVGSLLSRL